MKTGGNPIKIFLNINVFQALLFVMYNFTIFLTYNSQTCGNLLTAYFCIKAFKSKKNLNPFRLYHVVA